MKVEDLMSRMSGVMVFRLHLIDSAGCYVMDDLIDYVHMDHSDCDSKALGYGDWYVEEIVVDSSIMVGLLVCQVDREVY